MRNQLRLRRWSITDLPKNWFQRSQTTDETLIENVKYIISKVAENGDAALIEFTEKFDKVKLNRESLKVAREEFAAAYNRVSKQQIEALELIKNKVTALENRVLEHFNIETTTQGIRVRCVLRPLESVGCYVPGGQAAYPSSVVMTAAPAKTAGVPRIVVCTPPNAGGEVNPLVLVAADICGVNEVYKVGGTQAIAALAYGTETIKPVCKIVGPGNKYVTAAKILVSKDVAVDMPAGPSEVLVLADETADPRFVALDMVSQAEHGADSVVGLITTSQDIASEVVAWLKEIAGSTERSDIVQQALAAHGFIITCSNTDEMVRLANIFAPEHLEIMTQNPQALANKISSAGLILIGAYSPVALSDYGSGTNHVLPTGGFGHVYSGLSALDFTRRVSIVESSKEGLAALENHVKVLTEAEKLPNHYKAVAARVKK